MCLHGNSEHANKLCKYGILPLLCECKQNKITTFIFSESLRPKKTLINRGPLRIITVIFQVSEYVGILPQVSIPDNQDCNTYFGKYLFQLLKSWQTTMQILQLVPISQM